MAQNPGFAERLAKAHGAYYSRHGTLFTQEEIGIRVGKILRSDPVSQQKVGTWFAGREPDYEELRALAVSLEADPCYLAFGDEPGEWDALSAELTEDPGPGKGVSGVQVLPQKGKGRGKPGGRGKYNGPVKQ